VGLIRGLALQGDRPHQSWSQRWNQAVCGTLTRMPGLTEPHSDLAGRLDFETLISDLSAKLVTASDETLQTVVEDALGRVIQFFGATAAAFSSSAR